VVHYRVQSENAGTGLGQTAVAPVADGGGERDVEPIGVERASRRGDDVRRGGDAQGDGDRGEVKGISEAQGSAVQDKAAAAAVAELVQAVNLQDTLVDRGHSAVGAAGAGQDERACSRFGEG